MLKDIQITLLELTSIKDIHLPQLVPRVPSLKPRPIFFSMNMIYTIKKIKNIKKNKLLINVIYINYTTKQLKSMT